MKIFLCFLLAGGFGVASFRLRWLSPGGTLAASLFGFCLLYFGDWFWIVPVLLFFGTSNLLSKWRRSNHTLKTDDIRNGWQVICNGGVAWALLLIHVFNVDIIWYVGFLGAIAAATADTWGTEVGRLTQGKARSIFTGKLVEIGESGGVSWQGTGAGVIGAGMIALVAIYSPSVQNFSVFYMVLFGGVVGSLIDSLLGATIQARFKNLTTGEITEEVIPNYELASGARWITNNTVNLFCTASGAICAMVVYLLS